MRISSTNETPNAPSPSRESAALADEAVWTEWLGALRATDWVVYAKPPFGGPERVLKHLDRYTHRVAIANERIVSIDDGVVRFRVWLGRSPP